MLARILSAADGSSCALPVSRNGVSSKFDIRTRFVLATLLFVFSAAGWHELS